MEKKTVILDLLDRGKTHSMINTFMHVADVFEQSKELVEFISYSMVAEGDSWKKLPESIVAERGDNLIFCGIKLQDEVNGRERVVYFKKGVRTVTMHRDGSLRWGLFKDVLEKLGYIVEVDEHMTVIAIS